MRNRYNCSNCNYKNECEDLKEARDDPNVNFQEFAERGCFGHSYFDEKEAEERGFSLVPK